MTYSIKYSSRMTIKEKLIPKFLRKYVFYYREHGFKKTVKKFGWKLFAIIFLYYLIRDSILYIIIPYFVLKGIF
ncbi:MAG: hypothetical protein Ct9H90mP3_7000 [Flammeovirgaceae bacterium]|nr:MAG: hypothetical protein Ct9H90mP3_7000 [Flammeovirgaceae bacterium]